MLPPLDGTLALGRAIPGISLEIALLNACGVSLILLVPFLLPFYNIPDDGITPIELLFSEIISGLDYFCLSILF